MNIPASLLSENYKSMQEHDDRMILNENNTSIIQAWEIIPLKLCPQNTKADFFGCKLVCESQTTRLLRATSVRLSCAQRTSRSLPTTKCQLRLAGRSAVMLMPCPDPGHWGELCPQRGGDLLRSARSHTLRAARSRGRGSSPACDPGTSTDADVQGLLAKILTAALGPGVIHQMFTCTDRCLCWSSRFNSHYIIYQATDVIIND